jgi:hypothetical protein
LNILEGDKMKKARTHREFGLLTLVDFQLAEEEGFEPPEPCGSTVFKTAAFDRSATPL